MNARHAFTRSIPCVFRDDVCMFEYGPAATPNGRLGLRRRFDCASLRVHAEGASDSFSLFFISGRRVSITGDKFTPANMFQ